MAQFLHIIRKRIKLESHDVDGPGIKDLAKQIDNRLTNTIEGGMHTQRTKRKRKVMFYSHS